MEYKSFSNTPSALQTSAKNGGHPVSDCLNSKKSILFSTSRRLLLRSLSPRLPASACSHFRLLPADTVSATARLELPLPITISLYVLRDLTQQSCTAALCRTADVSFASIKLQQYKNTTKKHFWDSGLVNESLNPLPAARVRGFKRDDIDLSSSLLRTSRAALQEACGVNLSRGTTSDDVGPYKETLSSTSRSSTFTPSSAMQSSRSPKKV